MKRTIHAFIIFLVATAALTIATGSAAAQDQDNPAARQLEKAVELLAAKDGEIRELKNVIATLEAAKLTPCAIAIQTTNQELKLWLSLYATAPDDAKREYQKTVKSKRKETRQIIRAQCNIVSKSAFGTFIDQAKTYAPLIALIFLKK